MLNALKYTDELFSKFLETVVIITSLLITAFLVVLVCLRYGFDTSINGLHEASLVAAMWLYMFGATIASRRREHLVVNVLEQSLQSQRLNAAHQIFIALLTWIITLIFIYWTWRMFAWGMKRPQTIPGLGLPLWVSQLPLAVVAIASSAYAVRDIICGILRLNSASILKGDV